jgi:hypothetical protein
MDQQIAAPVRVELDAPLEVANWRPLVHWFLAIPHMFIMYFLGIAQGVLTFIAFFAILFTKSYPEGMYRFVVMTFRYQWRVNTYVMFMRESYPPFEFGTELEDTIGDPAKLSVAPPVELARFMPLIKWLLAIPHYIALMFVGIAVFFAWIGAFFAVLFTGKYPPGIRDFVVGVSRWVYRVQAYTLLLRDEYPPFSTK